MVVSKFEQTEYKKCDANMWNYVVQKIIIKTTPFREPQFRIIDGWNCSGTIVINNGRKIIVSWTPPNLFTVDVRWP